MNEAPHVRADYGPTAAEHRAPPQNVELEMCVLGAVMLEPATLSIALDILSAESFYLDGHALLFTIFGELAAKGVPPDSIAVLDALRSRNLLDKVGGSGVVMGMLNSIPTAANIEHHSRLVAEKARRRNLIRACTGIINEAYDESLTTEQLLDMAESTLLHLTSSGTAEQTVPMRDALLEYWEALNMRERAGAAALKEGQVPEEPGIKTGMATLDRRIRGLRPGQMITILAAPGGGKSALALQMAVHAAQQNVPVLIFSLEMTAQELVERALCMRTWRRGGGISSERLDRPWELQQPDWDALSEAYMHCGQLPIHFYDRPATMRQITSISRQMAKRHKIGLIIVDYLTCVDKRDMRLGDFEHAGEVAQSCKRLASELRLPVIIPAQLSKAGYEGNKKADLSHARDSGVIIQASHTAIFIWTEVKGADPSKPQKAILDAKKARGAPGGKVDAWFWGATTLFTERTNDAPPANGYGQRTWETQ